MQLSSSNDVPLHKFLPTACDLIRDLDLWPEWCGLFTDWRLDIVILIALLGGTRYGTERTSALFSIRIDWIKQIFDTFGYQLGESPRVLSVLQKTARARRCGSGHPFSNGAEPTLKYVYEKPTQLGLVSSTLRLKHSVAVDESFAILFFALFSLSETSSIVSSSRRTESSLMTWSSTTNTRRSR